MARLQLSLRALVCVFLIQTEYVNSDQNTDFRSKRQTIVDVEDPIVKVEQGLLRGEILQSAAGGSFYSFKGIPYAKPPVGQLRFKDAERPLPWQRIREAKSHGNVCLQPSSDRLKVIGDEDCLYLNVYTPRLANGGRAKLPVMFWIHGGGYTTGSGNSDVYGPDYLLHEDVILVTINYRLGAMGFLYLNDAAPGNAAMKDQVAALRWVQRNIAAFGGDPSKVTIFGQSAGAASVQLLLLSPLTRGLFHAAIAQSNHAVNNWANSTAREEISLRLASYMGCSGQTDSAIVSCLRSVNASDIVVATAALIHRTEEILPMGFLPTLDLKVAGVEQFMPDAPIHLITSQRYHAVPFIMGFTNKEAYYVFKYMNLFDVNIAWMIDHSWDSIILPILRLNNTTSVHTEALKALRNYYMNGQPLTNETLPGFMNMLSDVAIAEGIYFSLKYMSQNYKAPVYEYSFIVDDELNVMKRSISANFSGAVHADDIGYLFRVSFLPNVAVNSTAFIARARMVRLWTHFAKYRVPTSDSDQLLQTHWMPYTRNSRNFLEIGPKLRTLKNLNSARVAFWEDFYHNYGSTE